MYTRWIVVVCSINEAGTCTFLCKIDISAMQHDIANTCVYKIDTNGMHHDKESTCLLKIGSSGISMKKLVPVSTRLVAVICSRTARSFMYKIDSHGMHHDNPSTCISKIESSGMQHCEKQAGVSSKFIKVVCSIL